ncbi:TIGR03364 family FAD-dependent oxidoreductase [Tsukamurella sp. 8F]|uniref:TIGR03364 family FAD-dependent oxidoreductase n=1 Tax=unclassified Tsukamurella TaxID=2633480 RepID=UPI0023BA04F8|nr:MULTISPECIES: TIGR03364 family FAD-dependent oxidoreductase [unclassified Tsukamurella]MDF0529287.1 TIGR03364 family FAD-dependent oxidoreductase [Tsukamurella sp. 8J]MDF0586876.1 TIGR03364 family FAD-dependent oxidoreductase [Tsukamurella sp. 8F]
MSTAQTTELPRSCDVLVVGAGIVGLAHAVAALDAGYRVSVVERDTRPVGASIRNFGHVCVTGQTGDLAELAAVSRERWLAVTERAGISALQSGGIAVARSPQEQAVLDELRSRRPGALELLTAAQVRAALGGCGEDVVGGAHLRADLRVDPRTTVDDLARWLATQPNASVHFRTAYLGTDGTHAETTRGRIRADRIIVCTGHDLDHLYPALAEQHDVRRCALQMGLVDAPGGRTIAPAVLTGTSLLRYDAFAETAAAADLRTRLEADHPELSTIDANVMFTQRPDGRLLVGDSHRSEHTVDPFLDEDTTDTIAGEIGRVLGVDSLRFRQRWQGVYATSNRAPYLAADLDDHLSVRIVTSGVGMTIAFGLAARAL